MTVLSRSIGLLFALALGFAAYDSLVYYAGFVPPQVLFRWLVLPSVLGIYTIMGLIGLLLVSGLLEVRRRP